MNHVFRQTVWAINRLRRWKFNIYQVFMIKVWSSLLNSMVTANSLFSVSCGSNLVIKTNYNLWYTVKSYCIKQLKCFFGIRLCAVYCWLFYLDITVTKYGYIKWDVNDIVTTTRQVVYLISLFYWSTYLHLCIIRLSYLLLKSIVANSVAEAFIKIRVLQSEVKCTVIFPVSYNIVDLILTNWPQH